MPDVTFEELEEQAKPETPAAPAPKPEEIKLEGEGVPEALRGKTLADALKMTEAAQAALRISESARQASESAREAASRQPAAAPAQPQEEVLDREKLKELHETDPLAAMEVMGNHLARQLERSFATRMAPLATGTMSVAESWAKQEYPDEFELFGKEISEFASGLPDKTALASKKGWEDMISYIRGKKGNFEKYIDHRAAKATAPKREEAREQEREAVGFQPAPTQTLIPSESVAKMDAVQKSIADEFIRSGVFKDYAEYIKWAKAQG